ncbi:hypothetical protein C8C85_2336 [Flavobacterium sp. 103]|uniref:DUF6252 family protein n=1 Tax=Flavobacterium sp. 103 TaxID=2135624 RepID=UPI000D5CE01B|nr:DUF6252 family protein [Flavobacterium sp. 103]PVX46475.1 hypothetical protein C8C85_2336 [Flavobacterium sp. 103]
MKKLFFLFIAITLIISCNKDDDKPTNPIDQLPPATQTGANTAGCLLDGKAFLPIGNSPTRLVCQYVDGINFSIGINEIKNNKDHSIYVISYNQALNVGETYQLKEYGTNSKFGEYIIYNSDFSENHYKTSTIVNGELKITHHNFIKAYISGTFWFDAINSKGQKVQVREGRFDMEY